MIIKKGTKEINSVAIRSGTWHRRARQSRGTTGTQDLNKLCLKRQRERSGCQEGTDKKLKLQQLVEIICYFDFIAIEMNL